MKRQPIRPIFAACWHLAALLMLFVLGCAPATEARDLLDGAKNLACTCEELLVCHEDSCNARKKEACIPVEIRIVLSPPFLSICDGKACLEGKADLRKVSESISVLTGRYHLSTRPTGVLAAVSALIDTKSGTGFLQTGDESPTHQYSVMCFLAPAGK